MKNALLMADISPLPLTPLVAAKPWGDACRTAFNVPARAEGLKWGEIWLASEDFGVNTKVASGPQAGKSIAGLKASWGRGLTGRKDSEARQALPASFRLERTGPEPGPVRVMSGDEFWYVLEAGPDAWLGLGLKAKTGLWSTRFEKIIAEPGDSYLVPAGVVRVQGPSTTVLKALRSGSLVQTLHDWDRPTDLEDFTPPPTPVPVSDVPVQTLKTDLEDDARRLFQGDSYGAALVDTNFFSSTGQKMSLICPAKGQGRLKTSGFDESVWLRPGQAVILPAGLGRYSIESTTGVSYILFEFS
ncbi:MAG: hypothetical protein LBJ64_07705 [Deltaproteobacteria bacterium]|jgi:mannose-6-phosphate isomerase class I|nr:hypothetical protein [Deltaproteobacteria bacterium]